MRESAFDECGAEGRAALGFQVRSASWCVFRPPPLTLAALGLRAVRYGAVASLYGSVMSGAGMSLPRNEGDAPWHQTGAQVSEPSMAQLVQICSPPNGAHVHANYSLQVKVERHACIIITLNLLSDMCLQRDHLGRSAIQPK